MLINTSRFFLLTAVLAVLATAVPANVTLPHIFSDHMVLQQRQPIPIWGKADPGEAVTVTFAGQTCKTVADAQGHWQVRLRAQRAKAQQTGQTLIVTGKNTLTFTDVLIGEVWVCSGQSNMQFTVAQANNGAQEVANAKYPQIRLFTVPDVTSPTPRDDCNGQWMACSPDTVGGSPRSPFSSGAICTSSCTCRWPHPHFLGRHHRRSLNQRPRPARQIAGVHPRAGYAAKGQQSL